MKLPVACAGLALGLLGCVDEPRLGSSADGVTWDEFRAAVYREPGTGLFIVYNDRRDVLDTTSYDTVGRSFVIKFTRLFDL